MGGRLRGRGRASGGRAGRPSWRHHTACSAASESSLSCDVAAPARRVHGCAPMRRRLLRRGGVGGCGAPRSRWPSRSSSASSRAVSSSSPACWSPGRSPGTRSCAGEPCAPPGSSSPGSRSPAPWWCSSPAGRCSISSSSPACSWRSRAACATLVVEVDLPDAPPPQHPVLVYNPRSGGGKAERFAAGRRGARARDRADRVRPPVGPRRARAQGGRRRRRRARHGRRRRLAGHRRRDRRGARPALQLHPGRHAQPLRAGPRGRPRRRRRRARCVRRRRRAPRRPRRGQRARLRQQRVPGPLRRGRPARGLPRREAAHDPRHGARRPRTGRRRSRPALARARAARSTAPARRSSCPTTATGSAVRSGRARGLGSTTACSGSRSSADPPAAAPGAAGRSACGASGPRRPSRSTRSARSRPASTARRSSSMRRCGSSIRPGVLRVRIARAHPGASPSANAPEGLWDAVRQLAAASRSDASTNPNHQRSTVWI